MSQRRAAVVVLASLVIGASSSVRAVVPDQAQSPATAQAQDPAGAFELLFDQGKRFFDEFKYDEAVPLFDRLILAMTAGPEVQKPELLIQAYELRARARFALGDSTGAEQDFSALLALKPEFKLGAGVSPRVITVLDNVRRLTVGQLSLQVTPPGELTISGRTYTVTDVPLVVDLKSGEHVVNATRTNYTPFEQKITVKPGEVAALAIALERVSSTVSVITTPEDVEVLIDDVSKGRTGKGATAGVSAPLAITGVPLGSHRLRLRRECYVDFEMPVTVGAEDVQTEPLQLTPAVATVTIKGADKDSTLVIDGQVHGPIIGDVTVCAGSHVLEVRSARGRFVERREWKAGETVSLAAEMRSAVPIVIANTGTGSTPDQLRAALERALASSKRVMVFAPVAAELEAALKQENVPADWLNPSPAEGATRLSKEVIRDIGRRLSARLGVQGVAAATVGADTYSVTMLILAAGSGEPDVLTLSLADTASQGRAVERLSAPVPPLVRASLDSSFIDVAGVQGAVVVRAGAASGLAVGDVVTSAGGKPVASVAELRAVLASLNGSVTAIPVEAKGGPAAAVKKASSAVTMVVDTLPVRDPAILANRALFDLQDASQSAPAGVQKTAASIGLAIVQMRLGNWDDALAALKDVQLPDGPGVSAGTVAYLNGLALEGLGRTTDAQAAFTKASALPQARLWFEGPLVAPLAKAKLQNRR